MDARKFVVVTAAMLWLIAGMALAADSPEIQAEAGSEEIFVGDSIDYHVVIRNVKNPPAPDLSAIKQNFDVVEAGNGSQDKTSISIMNGQMTQRNVFSHVYRYRLTPKSTGDLTIPAVTATIDGKTISSDELPLRVIKPEKQDVVLVEIETSHKKVYPTQPFTVTVRMLVRPLPGERNDNPLKPVQSMPPHLQINWVDAPSGLVADDRNKWLRSLLADDGIGFTMNDVSVQSNSFFDTSRAAVFDLSKGREVRNGLEGQPIRYFVYELTRTFTAEKTGEYTFGPATVKGTFVTGIEKHKPIGRQLVSIASPAIVEVKEVPVPRPATYCGGIGEYQVTATASPTNLRVGDPLTLTLEFQRGPQSGSLELISAPDLAANPNLIADFELVDKNPTGRVEGSTKRFSYAMRPKHANVLIPSVQVSTFDPQKEQFVNRTTAPIPLDVSEAVRVSAGDLVGSLASTGPTAIKSRSQGIYQNLTDPSQVRDQRVDLVSWSIATASVWCLVGCLIAIVKTYRRKSSDTVWMRRLQARKIANRRLSEARKTLVQGNTKSALGLVRLAIIGTVADLKNQITEGLTTTDVTAALIAAGVPDQDRLAVSELLESIETAEYGGRSSADPSATIETASGLISRIYPCLERGS